MILMNYIILFIFIIMVLVSVGFFTLLERKVLSFSHNRVGPNKVSLIGLLQPFSDAIKLFSKEYMYVGKSNYFYYMLAPYMSLFMMMMVWLVYPIFGESMNLKFSLMYMLCCLSMNTYVVVISGWSSNSIYTLLGAMRCLGQMLSYEVGLFIQLMVMMMMVEGMMIGDFIEYQNLFNILFMFMMFIMLYITMLAELNRTPFDFIEGESELVSGFNTEYSSGFFAVFFISEYGVILFSSFLLSVLFVGKYFLFMMMFMMVSFIFVRASYPRLRYDFLMKMFWLDILPLSLLILMFLMMLKGVWLMMLI